MPLAIYRLTPTFCDASWFENRNYHVASLAEARDFARKQSEDPKAMYRWELETLDGVEAAAVKPSLAIVRSAA